MDLEQMRRARYRPARNILSTLRLPIETEKPSFRTLALISANCVLERAWYNVAGTPVMVYQGALPELGPDCFAIEVITDAAEFEIRDAHTKAEGVISEFLDRLALIAYAGVQLHAIFSTTPTSVKMGQEFQMVLPYVQDSSDWPAIGPDDISAFDTVEATPGVRFALTRVRKGLASGENEERFFNSYLALENIAKEESAVTVKKTCRECGAIEDTGIKATHNQIREELMKDGRDEKAARNAAKVRGKIAHGDGDRDAKFLSNLAEWTATVEGTAVGMVAERSGAKVRQRNRVFPRVPSTLLDCRCHADGAFSVQGFNVSTQAVLSTVSRAVEVTGRGRVQFGIGFDDRGFLPLAADVWPFIE
jgi:hypothetical protein